MPSMLLVALLLAGHPNPLPAANATGLPPVATRFPVVQDTVLREHLTRFPKQKGASAGAEAGRVMTGIPSREDRVHRTTAPAPATATGTARPATTAARRRPALSAPTAPKKTGATGRAGRLE